MTKTPRQRTGAGLPGALLALGIIDVVLVMPLWWRDGAWGSAWLVPEVGLLLLIAAIPVARRSAGLHWALAGVLTFFAAALLGDALVRAVFARPLDVALDPLLLTAGFRLLAGSLGAWAAVTASVLVAIGVLLTLWLMRVLVRQALAPPPVPALAIGAAAAVLLALNLEMPDRGLVRPALVELAAEQSRQVRRTLAEREALLARAESPRMQAQSIPALEGRDMVIVFVESYGASALDQPRYANTLRPVLQRAESELAAAGLGAVSTRMTSPIRGGQSWLAHATTLAGQPVDNNYWYRLLLESGQDMLTDDLRATGHTPLVVAPAIVEPWPEAEEMGFETIYPAEALDYRGPTSGWVGIPDQYTLHRYGRHICPQHAGPVFAMLLLISSHAPWSPPPPIVDDWSRLDRPNPWTEWSPPENDPLAYWRDTDRLRARYPDSLAYSLESIFSWAARDLPADALLIVLGDHQPVTLITGDDAGSDVPVHFVSRDAGLLERLSDQEIEEGLLPAEATSPAGMETLRFLLREL